MTEWELNQLHYLNIEISHLKQEIQKLESESEVKAQILTGMPSGNKLSDPTGDKGTELSENKMLLNLALAKAEIEKNKLERFIASIEDSEMRIIIRLRHINSLTWEEIGEELYMHRTTVKRKYFKFLKTEVARNAH